MSNGGVWNMKTGYFYNVSLSSALYATRLFGINHKLLSGTYSTHFTAIMTTYLMILTLYLGNSLRFVTLVLIYKHLEYSHYHTCTRFPWIPHLPTVFFVVSVFRSFGSQQHANRMNHGRIRERNDYRTSATFKLSVCTRTSSSICLTVRKFNKCPAREWK